MITFSAGVLKLRRAAQVVTVLSALSLPWGQTSQAVNVTLAWDLSTDPSAAGYNLYYGGASRNYTNTISVGNVSSATISNLTSGATYYFAATTYNLAGLESDFSVEVSYAPPATSQNLPPTLDQIAGFIINEDAGQQTVQLTGISSGSSSEIQTLTVTAFSSNPTLIPNPTVTYASPGPTGSLTFTPTAGSFGTASITVMVDDGGSVSNTVIRSFTVTVNPINDPPTLDPIDNLVINQNAGPQTVPLSGISAGNTNESQTITITATSSNPSLIPNPTVSYTSPNTGGSLKFTPAANAFGSAVITVTANDGQAANSTATRTFSVTVNQVVSVANIITNATIVANQTFRVVLNPPYANGDKFEFSLDQNAPVGASILSRKGLPIFSWTPTSAQASTTNLVTVRVTDTTTPSLSTNEALAIIVLDYLEVVPVASAVQAGQTATLPINVLSSEGVTNLAFTVAWPTNLLAAPTLTIPASSKVTGTAQLQGTDLRVVISSQPGRVMTGSNLVAQLTFQASSSQPSAFLRLGITNISGIKPIGTNYAVCAATPARVAVVNDVPLLEWIGAGPTSALKTYGRVGTTYQIQSTTNLLSQAAWTTTATYTQTTIVQTFSADGSKSVLLYRLKQQ